MARWITGITFEPVRVEVRAPAAVSRGSCRTNPQGCCPEAPDPAYGVDGAACCPDADAVEGIAAAASGPLGDGGAAVELDWTLTRTLDTGLVWSGEGEDGGPGIAVLARVYCRKDADGVGRWYAAGRFVDADERVVSFGPVALEDDGEHLTGEVGVPGREEPLTLAFDRPCGGVGAIVTACCEEPVPAALHLHLFNGSGGCECADAETAALTYDAVAEKWLGTVDLCGTAAAVRFYCLGGTSWALEIQVGGEPTAGTDSNPATTCAPFVWDGPGFVNVPGGCGGTFQARVDTTP